MQQYLTFTISSKHCNKTTGQTIQQFAQSRENRKIEIKCS